MNRIHRWKDEVNYSVRSEQGICRIIDFTTKILVNELLYHFVSILIKEEYDGKMRGSIYFIVFDVKHVITTG